MNPNTNYSGPQRGGDQGENLGGEDKNRKFGISMSCITCWLMLSKFFQGWQKSLRDDTGSKMEYVYMVE